MNNKKKSQTKMKIFCERCNRVGHVRDDCYALICDYCKNIGHQFLNCRRLQKDKNWTMDNARQLHRANCSKDIPHGANPENQPTTSDRTSSYYSTNMSNRSTVGDYRECFMSHLRDIIEITCEESKNRRVKMMVSKNIPVSLIKIGKLKDDVTAAKEVLILEYPFSTQVKTICLICLCIRVDKKTILHPCRVVSDDFYIETDGVLGRDFISKSQVKFGKHVKLAGVQIPFFYNYHVRKILKVGNSIEVSIKESDSETTDSS